MGSGANRSCRGGSMLATQLNVFIGVLALAVLCGSCSRTATNDTGADAEACGDVVLTGYLLTCGTNMEAGPSLLDYTDLRRGARVRSMSTSPKTDAGSRWAIQPAPASP